jgi:hypothetical protein
MKMKLSYRQLKSTLGRSVGGEMDTPLARWSIAAIAVILVWLWLLDPLLGWRNDLAEQAERNAKKAVRLLALQEQAEAWSQAEQDTVAALQQQLAMLFLQPTDTAAQAVLQQLLSGRIEARGLTIESQKLIEPEDMPGIGRKLGVAVNLRGSLANILQLLDDISKARHVLEIDNWMMRRDRNGSIGVQITVYGYRGEQVEA